MWNDYSGSMLLRRATVHYPRTKQMKYSNCIVNPSKYDKENQGIHFLHHHQACLIHYFGREQMPLLTHVIQCKIPVRSRYFINQVSLAWPGQKVSRLTQITRPSFNPDIHYHQVYESVFNTMDWHEIYGFQNFASLTIIFAWIDSWKALVTL